MPAPNAWPSTWCSAHRHPVDATDRWRPACTEQAVGAMNRSTPVELTMPSGPTWKADEATRDEDDEPLPWLDGGLSVHAGKSS